MFLRYRIVNSQDFSDAVHRMEDWLNQPAAGKVKENAVNNSLQLID